MMRLWTGLPTSRTIFRPKPDAILIEVFGKTVYRGGLDTARPLKTMVFYSMSPQPLFCHPSERMSSLDPFPFSHLSPQSLFLPSQSFFFIPVFFFVIPVFFFHPSLFFCHPSESWDLPAAVEAAVILILSLSPYRRKPASRHLPPFSSIPSHFLMVISWEALNRGDVHPGFRPGAFFLS
jgi:hypothetical protein